MNATGGNCPQSCGAFDLETGVEGKPTAKECGQGVPFERVRRITGYLVGTLKRFNNAKRAEERDRVKHATGGQLDDKR